MWRYLALAALLAAGLGWYLTGAERIDAEALGPHDPDLANGERIFDIGGCASCHAVPGSEDRHLLGGGRRLATPFGTFAVPNISPDPVHGIGAWSEADFASAMLKGTAPDGRHYYPAFPYPSYARMRLDDVRDLFAFLRTLPPSDRPSPAHEIGFPFSVNRGLGLWKLLHLSPEPVLDMADASERVRRGQYLVEGPGHCGECHTPRDITGGLDLSRWLAGAPNPEGEGRIPNITPARLRWSEADIAYYLESGFTPDYDSAGGGMAAVIANTSRLPAEDRAAIAAYLKAVPPRE
ncbi:MAG: cytochrome C [Alphaproteobacteria bacterium]|nr:MAG: cytochrome C [Alphaproteobacteria bacterium]